VRERRDRRKEGQKTRETIEMKRNASEQEMAPGTRKSSDGEEKAII
jgi:hypothetical protein